jgi:hypothetical protein
LVHEVETLVCPNVMWRYMDQLRIPGSNWVCRVEIQLIGKQLRTHETKVWKFLAMKGQDHRVNVPSLSTSDGKNATHKTTYQN